MRPEKNLIINEIKSRIDKTPYVLLADYTGMQVPQLNELRNRLSGVKAEFRVVKNTLLRRALQDSNLPDLESYLQGQSAVVLGENDVSAAAKILKNFTAEFQKPKLKVGILDRAVLNVTDIMALADLPAKEVLQAKLLGLLLAPASTLVRLINTPASQVAQVLKAYADKGVPITPEKPAAAPKAEAPVAEAKVEAPAPAPEATPVEAKAETPAPTVEVKLDPAAPPADAPAAPTEPKLDPAAPVADVKPETPTAVESAPVTTPVEPEPGNDATAT